MQLSTPKRQLEAIRFPMPRPPYRTQVEGSSHLQGTGGCPVKVLLCSAVSFQCLRLCTGPWTGLLEGVSLLSFLRLLLNSGAIFRLLVAGPLGLFFSGEENYSRCIDLVVLQAAR